MSRPTSRTEFLARVECWAHKLRVQPRVIRVQRMTRKWGSCSTKGTLSFSSEVLRQDFAFQDYVIVHELLHLRVPNHGKLFRSLLAIHVPNWLQYSHSQSRLGGSTSRASVTPDHPIRTPDTPR
jgi:predicted metal-dependent hydrolase